MSNKLDEARRIINEVDSKMAELFLQRMKAAELVYEHKKEFGLPVLDQAREDAVIERNSPLNGVGAGNTRPWRMVVYHKKVM